MSKRALIAMWAGIGLLALSWLIPPWRTKVPYFSDYSSRGFLPVFMPSETWVVDYPRIVLIDLAIVVITSGVIVTVRQK